MAKYIDNITVFTIGPTVVYNIIVLYIKKIMHSITK